MATDKRTLDKLTPREIVAELDKYIVGQKKAKRAVAVALRNRVRRLKLAPEVREDIAPKNILMIGPTGVGKTEIARRLAKLTGSPFIKVEATKYTEIGYVGRDVESMVRDLMASGVQMVKQEMQEDVKAEAEKRAEEALLDLLLPGGSKKKSRKKKRDDEDGSPVIKPMGAFQMTRPDGASGITGAAIQVGIPLKSLFRGTSDASKTGNAADEMAEAEKPPTAEEVQAEEARNATREKFRAMLREGKLEDRLVEIHVERSPNIPAFEMSGSGFEELQQSLSGLANMFQSGEKKKVLPVKRAREIIMAEESNKLIDTDRVSDDAKQRVEEMGIIFIDELDKIAVKGDRGGPDVSREGVQRDILPIVEGATVSTKWGPVDTSHILFIAAGAFTMSKPSDLIPELQGRFPLRVELDSLGKDEFLRILTEPQNALTKQYRDLLATEDIEIAFSPASIERLAFLAADVNSRLENIGARRLHTIMETLLEEISFDAPDIAPKKIEITPEMVNERLAELAKDQDLGRYIL
ncbi:MAG: ATP-dependent protease ATPase subunit HslU [Spirochaetaceae bacterium]|jgi:ATP-dependent HslUV protease ATP-binding subunit HslU|nr:ATP-dependent protease ATPase subunit HslU [Spirochaetaceae bacterium]